MTAPRRYPITWLTTVREAHCWQQMNSTMCEKQIRRRKKTEHHMFASLEKNPRKLPELTRYIAIQKDKWGDEEEASRAASCASASLQRVKESRWQQRTGAEGRSVRPRRRETSRRHSRRQPWAQRGKRKRKTAQSSATCRGKRQWRLGSFEHVVPSHACQNDVKASVNNAWQISPFCHMLSVGAFVLDGTNG